METTDKKVLNINLDDILPNRFQPRIKFDEAAINELAESIKEHGVIQPIVVRPIADKFEIIAGERRYKASVMAGKNNIPAIIVNLDDKESAEIALIENVQRQDLTPIEEAVSYKKILDMGYLTQQQLALKLGKGQATIANKLRLLNLHEDVQEALLNEKISERHARSLLKLEPKKQAVLLNKIINERLTVRKTDEEINKLLGKEPKPSKEEVIKPEKVGIPQLEIINFEEEKEERNMNNQDQNINGPLTNPVDPGFVDVNKIETTAQDLFTPSSPAPIDSLLTPSAVAPAPENPTIEDVEPLTTGRFFNIFNESNEENSLNGVSVDNVTKPALEPASIIEEPVQSLNNDIFGNFKPMPNTVVEEQKEVEIPEINQIQEPISPIVENNGMFTGFETTNEIPTPVEPVINPETPTFNGFSNMEPVNENVTLTPIQPISIEEEPIIEDIPSVMPAVEVIEEVSVPTEQTTQPAILSEPVLVETPIIEENIPEPIVSTPTNTFVAGDLKTVINTIRDCANTIEKYGYMIDVEELDFENTYQVTFKITKKK